MEKQVSDLSQLAEIALEENESNLLHELNTEAENLKTQVGKLTEPEPENPRQNMDPEQEKEALLTINAGVGGRDAEEWAQALATMYTRWAEQQGRPVKVISQSQGQDHGIRSMTLQIGGKNALGTLRNEAGVHRVVRRSRFDRSSRRHTSFAHVEVLPLPTPEQEREVPETEIRMEAFHSSGPGGQNIQKVASAIRLTHTPTGLTATCQTERSQHQNRQQATRLLVARVRAYETSRERDGQEKRSETDLKQWGSQIRSYFLHPKELVKDHRTGAETHNARAVLEGNLATFIPQGRS